MSGCLQVLRQISCTSTLKREIFLFWLWRNPPSMFKTTLPASTVAQGASQYSILSGPRGADDLAFQTELFISCHVCSFTLRSKYPFLVCKLRDYFPMHASSSSSQNSSTASFGLLSWPDVCWPRRLFCTNLYGSSTNFSFFTSLVFAFSDVTHSWVNFSQVAIRPLMLACSHQSYYWVSLLTA